MRRLGSYLISLFLPLPILYHSHLTICPELPSAPPNHLLPIPPQPPANRSRIATRLKDAPFRITGGRGAKRRTPRSQNPQAKTSAKMSVLQPSRHLSVLIHSFSHHSNLQIPPPRNNPLTTPRFFRFSTLFITLLKTVNNNSTTF